jgi:sporulation protein YlmC with PRC-barrel domain
METAGQVAPMDDTMATDDAMDTAASDQPVEPMEDDAAMETGAIGDQPADTMDPAVQPMDPFDPANLTAFDESTLTAEELIGTNVYGPENEHIGTIGDLVLGEEEGTIDAIIVDFGGFLGIGVKEVAVGYDDLSFYIDDAGSRSLLIDVTREQMEQAVAFNRDTYEAERDAQRMSVSSL